jgi:SAM-dependent methyltransferase
VRLENVVPWGRSFDEYVTMFDLAPSDLEGWILDCGSGPAGFTAEMARRRHRIVACDPLYQFSADQIRRRVDDVFPVMLRNMEETRDLYVWAHLGSPAQAGATRIAAMRAFLADFRAGREGNRYVAGSLPALPFKTEAFDLARCSHFLFPYSEHLSAEFHLVAILELLRVARRVRVFPVLDLDAETSPHLSPTIAALRRRGFTAQLQTVPYEFQKGGNQLLTIERARDRARRARAGRPGRAYLHRAGVGREVVHQAKASVAGKRFRREPELQLASTRHVKPERR